MGLGRLTLSTFLIHCLSFSSRETFHQFTMTYSVRENLIRELKGQTFRFNDLGSILPGWCERTSSEAEALRKRIEPEFDMYEHFYQPPIMIPCHIHVIPRNFWHTSKFVAAFIAESGAPRSRPHNQHCWLPRGGLMQDLNECWQQHGCKHGYVNRQRSLSGLSRRWEGQWRLIDSLLTQLFAWDDGMFSLASLRLWLTKIPSETDSTELSTRSRKIESMQNFRSRTSKFVQQSLGFAVAEDEMAPGPLEQNPLITSFGVIGEAFMTSCTIGRPCRWKDF